MSPWILRSLSSFFGVGIVVFISVQLEKINKNEQILERKNCLKDPIGCGIIFKSSHLLEIGLYDEEFQLNEEKENLIDGLFLICSVLWSLWFLN